MTDKSAFLTAIQQGYTCAGETIQLGAAMLDGAVYSDAPVRLPLRTMNRHGLIAGATGTGKTKTLSMIAEGLSEAGVPVLMMDIKGDLSGMAQPGTADPKIDDRMKKIGMDWSPSAYPVEFLSISNDKGVRLRATVHEFGPILFSKILGLNDTQSSLVSLVYKFCDDKQLPLLDLKDFKKVLEYITGDAKAQVTAEYGLVPTTSMSLILRKLIELEQQGAELFFGEKSFEVADLCRTVSGFGVISILRLTDIQDRPKLFSSFMLQMLGEIYASFPEAGDLDKPKLVLFIDEAHLIFDEAEKPLLDQINTIIKLIRSKGIGIFFCTQSPADIPNEVLGQLGLKVQHALRAFTAQDQQDIKRVAKNYPLTDFYSIENVLTSLGIGEAFVTALNEKGIPTPLAATLLCTPRSRMGILTPEELDAVVARSPLAAKYNTPVDPQSAYEMLGGKITAAAQQPAAAAHARPTFTPSAATDPALSEALGGSAQAQPVTGAAPSLPYPVPQQATSGQPGALEKFFENQTTQRVLRSVATNITGNVTRAVTRSLLGVIGFGGRRR
jgi:uncharacterized protein